jgi:iron complex outermembrane receptor protein/hemoglobin/transferrin/lactoferrin receptor protein
MEDGSSKKKIDGSLHPHPPSSDGHEYPSPAGGRGVIRHKRNARGEGGEVSDQESKQKEAETLDAEYEEIVITARRDKQPAFEVDRSLHLLSSEEIIEQQGQTLPDVLQETTGVFMQRTNRGAGAPIMRGLVGPQNLIMIDGIRFNTSTFRTGPNQYLAMIDPTAIDRIEVMLGPGSVLYGSDAMGGVIQIFPLEWKKEAGFGALAGARFVSYDLSTAYWVNSEWQNQNTRLLVGGTYRNLGSLRAGEGVEQPISDYMQGSWRARAGYRISDAMELGVSYLGMRVRDSGRADRLYEGRFRFYDNDDDLMYLDFKYRPGNVLKELRVAASFHRMYEVVDRYRCNLPDNPVTGDADLCLDADRVGLFTDPLTRQEVNTDSVLTPGLLAKANFAFWENRARVTTGLEAYFDFVSSDKKERRSDRDPAWEWITLERGNFSDGSSYRSLGAFAHLEAALVDWDNQVLVAGLGSRISNFSAQAADVPGLGDIDYNQTGLIGTVGLKYLYEDSFMAYANFSQGFRSPNLQETTVLGDTGSKFEVPGDQLEPEKSNTLEIGSRLNLSPVQLYLSGFISFIDDVIDEREMSTLEWNELGLDPDIVGDKPVVQRINSASALYWGMESSIELGPWFNTRLWARLAWVRGEIESQDGDIYPARRVPPLMGVAGIRFQPKDKGFYLEIFSRMASKKTFLHPSDMNDLRICEDPNNLGNTYADSGQKCDGTDGWITLNLRGGYRLDSRLMLDLAATNLTDELYRYHGSGLDAPGVGVSVSVIGSY